MERKETWREDLQIVILKWHKRPFAWGTADCCVFCGECVEAMTGEDLVAPFLGYTTRQGATDVLQRVGKGSLMETLREVLGEPVAPHTARTGDVMFKMFKEKKVGFAIGICVDGYGVFLGEDRRTGVARFNSIPKSECGKAFRVG